VAVLVAIGVNAEGYREVIGCEEGYVESEESWKSFLLGLRERGLSGVRMFTGDKSQGMLGAIQEAFPHAMYQRCTVHFYRNALDKVPRTRRKAVAASLRAIHAQESREKCLAKAREVASELRESKLEAAAKVVESGAEETLTYALFPREHWRRIRTNNGIERLNREIKRRTDAVGSFPAGDAAVMLAAARCKYVAEGSWGSRRYLDTSLLDGWDEREVLKAQRS
jgi:putative transposase